MSATTLLTIRNIIKKGQSYYTDYANKPIAFCFDLWDTPYNTRTGERGKILEINGIPISTIIHENLFTGSEVINTNNPGFDRIALENVARYNIQGDWYIKEPQYNPINLAPYLAIYQFKKIIAKWPDVNPLTNIELDPYTEYIDTIYKAVIFGFVNELGVIKDIQGTCGNNIILTCDNNYIPTKLTGCRLDILPSRIDCGPSSINFDFTLWNNRPGFSGLILGDIPISK